MIRIGLFAAMNKITVKTLRYYDEEKLLKPAKVDDWTGYRYYSANQMIKLRKILNLKEIGFRIDEIRELLGGEDNNFEDALKNKKKEAETNKKSEEARAKKIEHYLKELKKENKMSKYDVVIKDLPTVTAACKKTNVPDYDAFFKVVPEMGEVMKKHGAKCAQPEYCFNIFHDGEYKEKDINVEICEAVEVAKEGSDGVEYRKIEGGKAACALHKGPYSNIGDAYEAVTKWSEDNEYEIVGPPRESYIDGIWNKEDKNDWLTEVQIPVK